MAINKFVSLDVPIQDMCFLAGLDHDAYYPIMIRWAKKAYGYMRDCGAAVTRYTEPFVFKGCNIQLPEKVTAVEIVVWGDKGCDCDALISELTCNRDILPQRIYGATAVADYAGESNNGHYDFRIENDVMIFNKSFDGQVVTIRYWGFKNDCDGKLLVSEHAVDAIIAYLELNLAKQTRWKNKEFRLTETAMREFNYNWKFKLGQARGDMIQNTMQEEREMVSIYKNSGVGDVFYIPHYALNLY